MGRKITTEIFKQEIEELHPNKYTILGEYMGAHKKILTRYNACQHEYEAKAYKISSTGILTRIKSKSKQFDSFYYFDKSSDNKNNYIRYSPETFSSSLIGRGHLSSRKVFCEGQIFNSLKEASNFYNISRETIRQRCKSNNKNWKEFYIIEE